MPASAYTYVFEGQAQTLDHQFVTPRLGDELEQARVAHLNADWPADFAGDGPRGAVRPRPARGAVRPPRPSLPQLRGPCSDYYVEQGLVDAKTAGQLRDHLDQAAAKLAQGNDQKAGAAPARDKLQLVIKDLPRPNGIALSPDEKTLYIAVSGPPKWMKYSVKPDGSVADGKLLFDVTGVQGVGGPDGIKVDQGQRLGLGPGRCLDPFAGRQAPGDDSRSRAGWQPGVGRRRRQDSVHRRQHQRISHSHYRRRYEAVRRRRQCLWRAAFQAADPLSSGSSRLKAG